MTQKLPAEKLVSGLLQSIDPQQIADEGVRQTVELLPCCSRRDVV